MYVVNMSSVFDQALISYKLNIPMEELGGDIEQLLQNKLARIDGQCVEEGFIKIGSTKLVYYSCGKIKGGRVIVQTMVECAIANPYPGDVFECIVEHNTHAGIIARLNSKDVPFLFFLNRDHHNLVSNFSDIKEHDMISVTVLGQRFEVKDSKIYIIATLNQKSIDKETPPYRVPNNSPFEEESPYNPQTPTSPRTPSPLYQAPRSNESSEYSPHTPTSPPPR